MAVEETIKIKADTKDAERGADRLQKSFTSAFTKSAIAVEVYRKALSFAQESLTRSLQLALDYERSVARQAAALRGLGLNVNIVSEALNAQASEMERITGISDEVIRDLQSLALNMGIGVDRVEDFTKAAITLSNTTGTDATNAMRQLVKTLSGLKGELGESLPLIRNMSAEELKAGKAADAINKALGENLTLLTQGKSGSITSLNVAWDNFAESLGRAFINASATDGAISNLTSGLSALDAILSQRSLGDFMTLMLNPLISMDDAAAAATAAMKERAAFMGAAKAQAAAEAASRRRAGGGGGGGGGGVGLDVGAPIIWAEGGAEALRLFSEAAGNIDAARNEALNLGLEMGREAREAELAEQVAMWQESEQLLADHLEEQTEARRIAAEEARAIEERRERETQASIVRVSGMVVGTITSEFEQRLNLERQLKDAQVAGDEARIQSLQRQKEAQGPILESIARALMTAVGQQLIANGALDIGLGISRAWKGDLVGGLGQAGWGAGQVVAGGALIAGQLMLPSGSTPPGAEIPTGGADSGFGAGGSRGIAAPDRRGGDGGNIVINISGSLTNEETGVMIRRALQASQNRGF